MIPAIYRKRALKLTGLSLILLGIAVMIRYWAWNTMRAGGMEFAIAFILLAIFTVLAVVVMAGAMFFVIIARSGKR